MRRAVLFVLVASAAAAAGEARRRELVTYVPDLNGRREAAARIRAVQEPGRSERVQMTESINGRLVPVESREERVLSEKPGERVVEIVIRRYDQTGSPGGIERIRREERLGPGGERLERTWVERSDLNGRLQMVERSVSRTVRQGVRLLTDTEIERPSAAGGFTVAERRVQTESRRDDGGERDLAVYQPDVGGGFRLVARETTQIRREENRETSRTVRYDATASGRLEPAGETLIERERRQDGSEVSLVSLFGREPPGRPAQAGRVFLREQQRVERLPGPGGSRIERVSLRRPELADQRLGPFVAVSETVCTGDCDDSGSREP